MVYDPVRDCDIPSPAVSRRASLWGTPPPSATSQYGGPVPPAFQNERSPLPSPSIRPASAGLRSLLNDEPDIYVSRRGSDHTVSSVADDEHSSRPHLAKLLNEPAPPLRPTSSHSGHSGSPRLSSPSVNLHPGAGPRGTIGARSPHISPNTIPQHLVSSPSTSHPYDIHVPGPSSRRSSIDTQSMPPPEPPLIHRHEGVQSAGSVSPRAQSIHQPRVAPARRGSLSRPTSARSSSGGFAAPPPPASSSPEGSVRLLSEETIGGPNGRHPRPVKEYRPHQPSRYRSITLDELARLRDRAVHNNPLRRAARRAAPSWSAPSPRVDDMDGPRSGGPSRRGSTASNVERPYIGRNDDPAPGNKRHSAEVDADPKRRRTDYEGNVATIASHYNQRAEVGIEQREFSPIIGLKKFNNWVKSVLIGKFTPRRRGGGARVLDIGCGKGGDLNKWKQARIALYVGMDIAETSINQARERWQTMRGNRFEAFFAAHDCYTNPIHEALPPQYTMRDLYDSISMQFCMHYAFETPAKARMMMDNVTRYLKAGGLFIGTIPNSALLLSRLDEQPDDELTFGNSCYQITFAERHHQGIYGREYRFYLEDAVEDVPEYIVDWDNFVALAREYGLELVYQKTFNDILQEEQTSREFGPLLGKMGVINENGESAMDADQWEAANLYMAFAFEKR
ncbi:hypothetical protein CspHIS471_0400320 [Cutaneotrichosporon sp. HIS471]|nr:hypothetical protein CspHIS471_0400320 [Cutaneotrichosporon sp. HIS471]